jgi:hypothetical protein
MSGDTVALEAPPFITYYKKLTGAMLRVWPYKTELSNLEYLP